MRTRKMESETGMGTGRLGTRGHMHMGTVEVETENGEMGPRKMEV